MTPSLPLKLPRPYRNNNPLDLESGPHWQGLMPWGEMTPDQQREPRFAVFASPEFGFRAGVVLFRNYWRLHGLRSLGSIIPRFAPPDENLTDSYVTAMSHWTGFAPDALLDMESRPTLRALVRGATQQETGSWEPWWNDGQLDRGIARVFGQEE